MRSLIAMAVMAAAAPAGAAPLASRVTRMDIEPTLVIAPLSAGATAQERYRAPTQRPRTGTPLVLLVRLPPANSPDTVTVVSAERTGSAIRVHLETRRYTGPLAANVVQAPLIEIDLGTLPAGRHDVRIDETVLDFDRYDAPQRARNPRPGLRTRMSFAVDR